MAEQTSARRQVAFRVSVADILDNRYVKEEGWLPNYIAIGDRKVSRANIMGVIVSTDTQADSSGVQNFILDDGTGRVPLRFFESAQRIVVGDIVNVVGRPREFGTDRYIVPEIVKKVSDAGWVKVRKAELALEKHRAARKEQQMPSAPGSATGTDELSVDTEDVLDASSPLSVILDTIRSADAGSGVDFEEIAVRSGIDDAEAHIRRLIEQGDVFEVKPGRYKVLE
ncbi:hypothetical protein KY362_01805 [Candidatus Woesearchaeota archaeon]|nr:hypothetical protein [Candidatus Woesearchaeota archaeon]